MDFVDYLITAQRGQQSGPPVQVSVRFGVVGGGGGNMTFSITGDGQDKKAA